MTDHLDLLTTAEMAAADRAAVAAGVPSLALMENAGRAVADEAARMVAPGARIGVLCGPGNNGGDGFVAARLLAERGYAVEVFCLVETTQLRGDAAAMAARWAGPVAALPSGQWTNADLVIDALFGAGLTRPLEGTAASVIDTLRQRRGPILAVDVPSGVDGNTGDSPRDAEGLKRGPLYRATRTVTFVRAKPGHVLQPGRVLCGAVVVADIGIDDGVVRDVGATTYRNAPRLWRAHRPRRGVADHKYTAGHAVVVSGPPEMTGAARLGARAALRIGAGLVTVATSRDAFAINAAHLTAIMLAPFDAPEGLKRVLADRRVNAVLIGPGCGLNEATRGQTAIVLRSIAAALTADASEAVIDQPPRRAVLDADALSAFADEPAALLALVHATMSEQAQGTVKSGLPSLRVPHVVLTPHEGEFKRLFGDVAGSKLVRARAAAKRSGAILVLKGSDTVLAHPDGRAAINDNAPPTLATAGSGDVLAGFITGLLAQGMPAFEAACAAVWLHGDCANQFGPGLIAEDLPEVLPRVLAALARGD